MLDLSRPAGLELELEVSEAAEVLMSICALGDRDEHETFDVGGDWLGAQRDALPADLVAAVDELRLGSTKLAAHLLGIVWETPAPRTFAAFFERLEELDPAELKLHLFGAYDSSSLHIPKATVERAVGGDEAAIEECLLTVSEWTDKHELYRNLMRMPGDELKAKLLDLLPRWRELVFLPHEEAWRDAAERDVEVKRTAAARRSPEAVVELATSGYQYSPPPAIRTIALFPSWWMRPWVILWEHKSTKIFCYPIAPQGDEVGPAEVARVYKALGDEGRLKLLRRLAEGPLKLSEAAAELGVAKSTAHHHLAILRQAGFVTMRDADEKVYSLRPELPEAGELLAGYLSRSSATIA